MLARLQGSSQPLPSAEAVTRRGLSWPALFSDGADIVGAHGGAGAARANATVPGVGRVWVPIDCDDGGQGQRVMPEYDKCFQGF